MLEGKCHCGAVHWTFDGDPGAATACNCTVCRRYGVLWIYDYEGERVKLFGPTTIYTRNDRTHPVIEFHFCGSCACVASWRGLKLDERGRRGMAVNIRLAEPETVAHLPIQQFDGLDKFDDLPRDGRCVKNMWF